MFFKSVLGHSLRIHEGNEHYIWEEILYNINPQIARARLKTVDLTLCKLGK